MRAASARQEDFDLPYVRDLSNVIDAIRGANLNLGVDPLGGTSLPDWDPVNSTYGLNVQVAHRLSTQGLRS